MASSDSAAILVARYLRASHFNETLEAFIREAGLPADAGSIKSGAWTIESILEEKKQFDTSLSFERQGEGEVQGWTKLAPDVPHEPATDINANVLCVNGDQNNDSIIVTSADKVWKTVSGKVPYDGASNVPYRSESPILSTNFVDGGFILSTAMSGHLSLRRVSDGGLIDECRHHQKYAVQVASYRKDTFWTVATAGWDQKVIIYHLDFNALSDLDVSSMSDNKPALPGFFGEPAHVQTLPSNPESIAFVCHPDTGELHLVASRRDSTHISYYRLGESATGQLSIEEAGRQNLAPHSNAWVAFTPCSLSLCPTDATLMAVATSHLPHMKLIIVRLLFPGASSLQDNTSQSRTQASVARAQLALQDREDAAIKIQVTTLAPQTPYSTPQVVWRPDGSGLFVNGDDGVIRGLEANTGKVICLLRGHEAGSKVRTLWAGKLRKDDGPDKREILVSGGFDKKVFIWTSKDD